MATAWLGTERGSGADEAWGPVTPIEYMAIHIYDVIMDTFQALAEPIRRSILNELVGGECPVGTLVETLDTNQPLVSRHLRILRDAQLVTARGDAQRRLYRLADDALVDVDAWLAPYRLFWAQRLDALETYLDLPTNQEERR